MSWVLGAQIQNMWWTDGLNPIVRDSKRGSIVIMKKGSLLSEVKKRKTSNKDSWTGSRFINADNERIYMCKKKEREIVSRMG